MVQNKAFMFKKAPTESESLNFGEHIKVEEVPIDLDADLQEGSVLVKTIWCSLEPYFRLRLRAPEIKSYAPAFEVNKPVPARTVFKIVKSANSKFKEGQIVVAFCDIANYAILPKASINEAKVFDNPHNLDLAHYLGALGIPGLTAYSSFYDIGKPKKGETIFISAASGGVGQLVLQLAKHEGLITIGSAGDDKKVEYITNDLKCDKAFNYKKEKTADALKRLAPDGIDIYYDNVGGDTLDAALVAINDFGRIVACGGISQYNLKPEDRYGVKNLTPALFAKRLTVRGFIVADENMGPVYEEEHVKNVSQWLADGTFKAKLDVYEGIDKAGDAISSLFSGANQGKVVLHME